MPAGFPTMRSAKKESVMSRSKARTIGKFSSAWRTGRRGAETPHNFFSIIDTSTPGASSNLLQHRPQAGVVRQRWMSGQFRVRTPRGQYTGAFFGIEAAIILANQIHRAFEFA